MTTSSRSQSRLAIAVLVVFATACGSTVPAAQQAQLENDAAVAGLNAGDAPALGDAAGGTGLTDGAGADSGATSTTSGTGGTFTAAGAPAAGTTGDPGGGGGGPDPAGTAPSNGPLKVGVAYIDNEKTQGALGVSSDQTANGRSAARAMVKGFNAGGGVNGREIKAVEYAWDTSSNNWSTDASAACEKFTRDEPVTIVLDAAFGTAGGFGDCLQRAGVLHITNGPEGDRVHSAQRSLHANTGSMVDDRIYTGVVANLADTGYLKSRNQIGVMLEQCPAIERAYTQSVKPLMARLGLAPPVERRVDCTTGFASAGPAGSAVSGAVLAFRQANVDRVMLVSDHEAVLLLLFANTASSQQYFPGYALSSGAQTEALRSDLPRDQWPQLHGVGTSPSVDVAGDGKDPAGVDAQCVRIAKRGGLTAHARVDYAFVYGACGLFLLLESALARTGNATDPVLLQRAINGLGTSFRGPGLVANSTRYTTNAHDGPDAVQVFGYVAQCTCIRYRGHPLRAPR